MGSCESLAKSPNLSFLPLKFPFEIRFTDRPVSRINQLPIDISFPLPPSPYTQSGITFLFRTPPLLNHPAGCIVQKDYDKFDKYEILLFISRLLVDLEKKKYIGDISRRSPFDIYPRRTIPSRKGNIEGKGEIDYRLTNYLIRVESKFKRPRK